MTLKEEYIGALSCNTLWCTGKTLGWLNDQEPLLSNTTVFKCDLRQVTCPHGAHFLSFKRMLIIYIRQIMFTEIFEELGWETPFTYKVVLLFKSLLCWLLCSRCIKGKQRKKEKKENWLLKWWKSDYPKSAHSGVGEGGGGGYAAFINYLTSLRMSQEAERDWSAFLSNSEKQNLR